MTASVCFTMHGIGVSGGNWELDDRLAREAVEAIGATWKIDSA